jgi:hypothetical protein
LQFNQEVCSGPYYRKVEICGFSIPEYLNNPIKNRCFIYGRKYNRYGEEKHTHKHRSFVDFGTKTLLFDFQNILETKFWMRYCKVCCATLYKSTECERGRSINEIRALLSALHGQQRKQRLNRNISCASHVRGWNYTTIEMIFLVFLGNE